MSRNEIIRTIKMLAMSQGFYGRLLNDLLSLRDNDPDKYEDIMQDLEAQNFSGPVDFILYIEG